MKRTDFDQYYERYRSVITAIARKLAGRDDDLVADLEQEGAIALWNLNPGIAVTNLDAMVRQAIKFRQIDYLRRQNPQQYESLDGLLEGGNQLESDPLGGSRLVSAYRPSVSFARDPEDDGGGEG